MQLRSFFFHIESTSTVTFILLNYNKDTFCCNKDSEQLYFFLQKTHRIRSSLHFTACVFNKLFFSHHSWRNPWSPSACSTTLTPPALCFRWLRQCMFFSSTLFPAYTFLILILQTVSYKFTCWLTLISGGCGVLRLTRVLHTKLKRPGNRSNRLGPDPDPADHLKYRPNPYESRVLPENLYCTVYRLVL